MNIKKNIMLSLCALSIMLTIPACFCCKKKTCPAVNTTVVEEPSDEMVDKKNSKF